MPIYEYKCQGCKTHHEIMQKITDEALSTCPDCGGDMKKMISSTSFVLKGTGWYATDYASDKRKSCGSKTEKKTEAKAVEKGEKKTGENTGHKEAAVSK